MEPMIKIALRAARKAGENIVRASDELHRFEVKAKGVNNFVTEVDLNAEQENYLPTAEGVSRPRYFG